MVDFYPQKNAQQPCSQGLSSLLPLVVGTETLVAAGHETIYPSKTAGWVGTQVHLDERTIKYPTLPADFSTTQILGGHVTSYNHGLCSNDQGRQRRETLGMRLNAQRLAAFFRFHIIIVQEMRRRCRREGKKNKVHSQHMAGNAKLQERETSWV